MVVGLVTKQWVNFKNHMLQIQVMQIPLKEQSQSSLNSKRDKGDEREKKEGA